MIALIAIVFTIFVFAEDVATSTVDSPLTDTAFSFAKGDNLALNHNGNSVTLCPVNMNVDLNGDNKTNSADSRMLLRHSAKIELYTGPLKAVDITEDGKIDAADGRLVLRYSANLDKYYRLADGTVFSGLCTTGDNKILLVDEYGAVSTCLKTIDGAVYYFEKGIAAAGARTIGGELYYFANDGKGMNGEAVVNGKTLYFVDGKCFSGYRNVNGENVYYLDGSPANGSYEIDGTTYYFENGVSRTGYKNVNGTDIYYVNGVIANGFADIGSDTYYFINGVMQYSWNYINGNYYFLDRSTGKLARNTTIDGLTVDKDGKAVQTAYSLEKIKTLIKAKIIVDELTEPTDTVAQKKQKCFEWVMTCPYRQYRKVGASMKTSGWEMLFANDIFVNGNGCCGSTSAAFAFLAVECGCTDVYFCDDGVSTGGHAWVTMEGNNRVYDIIFAKSKGFDSNYDASVSDYRAYAPRKTYIGG